MPEFGTFVLRNGQLVRKGGPMDIRPPVTRSILPCPMIISDTLPDVVSPITGKPFDSKSSYYRHVKENGCSIIGNDKVPSVDRDVDTSTDIERTIAEVLNG